MNTGIMMSPDAKKLDESIITTYYLLLINQFNVFSNLIVILT